MKLFVIMLILISSGYAFAQNPVKPKELLSTRSGEKPKVDGSLEDKCWINVPIATGFVEANPVAGRIEAKSRRTEVKIIYDDDAIYVAARMFDDADSVAHELVTRDNIGTADYIGLIFDTFLDKRNGNGFLLPLQEYNLMPSIPRTRVKIRTGMRFGRVPLRLTLKDGPAK
jgi:hypothetical protein